MTEKKKKYERALILSGGGTRGPYQVGVWKFLSEFNWKPDLICGSSIGAINSVLFSCEIDVDELIDIWRQEGGQKNIRIPWFKHIKNILLGGKAFVPLFDTKHAERIIRKHLKDRIKDLRNSDIEVIITAVHLLKSELKFFDNSVIDIEHILASGAIPLLFPWRYIDGEAYWDGGVMMNTPILPAIERGAKEIIVVMLTPVGGNEDVPLPRTRAEAIDHLMGQISIASYNSLLSYINWDKQKRSEGNIFTNILQPFYIKDTKILTVAPQRRWDIKSNLSFSKAQVESFINEGYTDACEQLAEHFNLIQ